MSGRRTQDTKNQRSVGMGVPVIGVNSPQILLALPLYLLPLIVAIFRQTNNIFIVGLINVFLGATVIGWIVALVLAFRAPRHSAFS
jgi:hypothetical protein